MISQIKAFSIALLISVAGLSACSQSDKAEPEHPTMKLEFSTISGEFTYRERIALPPNAYASVKLNNISKADARSVTLTELKIDLNGKSVPISYELSAANIRLNPKNRYAIRVEIRDESDQLLWTTDQVHSVKPDGGDQTLAPIILKKI